MLARAELGKMMLGVMMWVLEKVTPTLEFTADYDEILCHLGVQVANELFIGWNSNEFHFL